MGLLYHGSKEHNLDKLEPRKSTHGTYVYATSEKALAVHFSKRCGDDLVYDIGHFSEDNDVWELVEKIPGALEKMYSNDSSIYTVSDESFVDINTGFKEMVSEHIVDVISEEYHDNVYDAILKLEEEGKIKIYRYPNKPTGKPKDNSDILDKWRHYKKFLGRDFKESEFDRLVFLHPMLLEKINELAKEFHYNYHYEEKDLIQVFQKRVDVQLRNLEIEQFIDCAYKSICRVFPDITLEITSIYKKYLDMLSNK